MLTAADKGKLASAKGFANESRLLAALLARGYNASKVDLPHSTYDILVEHKTEMFRVQVKTVGPTGSVSFVGGVRGGVDREYTSSIKEYVQSTQTSDVVVGVQSKTNNGDREIDFYFIPTLYIERLNQKSISINKIKEVKNDWKLLENSKDPHFVDSFFKTL